MTTYTLFPANPQHEEVFELRPGVLYQYDASVRSWNRVASSNLILPLVTHSQNGAMSAVDLKKLNRLVIPPPQSTIIGNDCVAPFVAGGIALLSGDEYVNVEGNLSLQNVDEFGDTISEEFPFQIHQHTYGYDFNLDIPKLVAELVRRGQLDATGAVGDRGATGDKGPPGEDQVLAGPAGDKGEQGNSPECLLSIEPETVQSEIVPDLERALVGVRVIPSVSAPNDPTKYSLEFDRQVVGLTEASTSRFRIRQQKSFWVLAVANIAGAAQEIYYIDIEPIIETVRTKFLEEVELLKSGYEEIVAFWIQTMSDLFDEQKDALCCAIECCRSRTKSTQLRQHMESVAASALPNASIKLHGRNSGESVSVPSTTTLIDTECYDQKLKKTDLCGRGKLSAEGAEAESEDAEEDDMVQFESVKIAVDPVVNAGTANNGASVEIPAGSYIATITATSASINGKHRANVKLQFANGGQRRSLSFLDKGEFNSLIDGRNAYEGLTLPFTHDGGTVSLYFPIIPQKRASGEVQVTISKELLPKRELVAQSSSKKKVTKSKSQDRVSVSDDEMVCSMDASHLRWYERSWANGKCCGLTMNIGGQEYIIIKRSIKDEACGGGEKETTPCIQKFIGNFGHPSFAWPTLDGETFVPIPDVDQVVFRYDQELNDLVAQKIEESEYDNPKGNPNGMRHLTYQLMTILFPAS